MDQNQVTNCPHPRYLLPHQTVCIFKLLHLKVFPRHIFEGQQASHGRLDDPCRRQWPVVIEARIFAQPPDELIQV